MERYRVRLVWDSGKDQQVEEYTILALDEDEAREWGQKQAEALGVGNDLIVDVRKEMPVAV